MQKQSSRRVFLMAATAVGVGFVTHARAQGLLEEKDPQAAALGYVSDAKRVDVAKFPKFAAGQSCGACTLFQGKVGDKTGGCPVFSGKAVAAAGWCSAWARKA